jgi:hypothetical protein
MPTRRFLPRRKNSKKVSRKRGEYPFLNISRSRENTTGRRVKALTIVVPGMSFILKVLPQQNPATLEPFQASRNFFFYVEPAFAAC